MISLPDPDSHTVWTVILAILSAPVMWAYKKIKNIDNLERKFITKKEFESHMERLESNSIERIDSLKHDIKQVDDNVKILLNHALGNK